MNQKHYSINLVLETAALNPDCPSLHPSTCTLTGSLTATHLGVITVGGGHQVKFQSHQEKLVHTHFRPHTWDAIPVWCVDSNRGGDYEGSPVGAWEQGLGRPWGSHSSFSTSCVALGLAKLAEPQFPYL